MITKINNSLDLHNALNENLELLLDKKRSRQTAKEVTNILGKIQYNIKMELLNMTIQGDNSTHWFFEESLKKNTSHFGFIKNKHEQ